MKNSRLLSLLFALVGLSLLAPLGFSGQPPKQDKPPERKKSTVDEEAEEKKPDAKPAAKPEDKPKLNLPAPEPEKPIQGVEKGPFNLSAEAEKAPHPLAKELLAAFAKPADLIVFRSAQAGQKEILVDPVPKRFDKASLSNVAYVSLDGKKGSFSPDQILRIDHDEARALAAVKKFLDSGLDKPDPQTGKPALSRFQMLRAAEKVLAETLTFHQNAKQTKQRTGDNWDDLGRELEKELIITQVQEVRALTADEDWGTAQALASRLYGERPGQPELMSAIQKLHENHATWLVDRRSDYFQARKILEQLKDKYKIELPYGAPAQERLVAYARDKLAEAKKLAAEGKQTEANKLLEEAAQAWPTLPGLETHIKQATQQFGVLRVGVRHLPTQLSPTTAASDIDRIASRLIFDPVLQIRYGPMTREGYVSKVGDEPRRVEAGWELEIPEYLKWSDGQPVSSADFLRSAELVAKLDPKNGSPLYDPDAADLLSVSAPDARKALFSFKRASVDPLSHLCFPLMPAHRLPSDRSPRDQAFGRQPVGTGPFLFEKMDGDEMVFLANPHYRRPWAPGGPSLKEIRFIRYGDFAVAKQALTEGRWQMLLDVTTTEKEELTGLPGATVVSPTSNEGKDSTLANSLQNPRIWFLGFNYRNPAFQNESVRRAIGLAIDRNAIVANVFRGKGRPYHQVLTGPYPNGTWAVPPSMSPVNGYQMTEATRLMNENKGSFSSLTLTFAEEDPSAAPACAAIKENLDKLGVTVNLKGMPAVQFKADLESEKPTFDLAYAHYDFPSEMLSLWPLFDPQSVSPLGQNFMGDCRDTALIGAFRSMQNKRDLGFVMRRTHEAYTEMWRKMSFVPLWQLDPHIAVHRSLQFTRLHPTGVFEDVEQWKLRKE